MACTRRRKALSAVVWTILLEASGSSERVAASTSHSALPRSLWLGTPRQHHPHAPCLCCELFYVPYPDWAARVDFGVPTLVQADQAIPSQQWDRSDGCQPVPDPHNMIIGDRWNLRISMIIGLAGILTDFETCTM